MSLGTRLKEHAFHVSYFAHVPLGQVLLEGTRLRKHPLHFCDFAHVPLGQVLVERFSIRERVIHVGDLGHIPLPNASVRPLGAIAHWRQVEACVNSGFEIRSVLR